MNGPRPQGGAPQQQAQGGDLGPDGKKKRRRRRGRGKGEGAEGAPQGGQRAQGQQGGPRSNAGRSGHGQQIARSESTGFFGMVKRLFRLLFGGGKK